MWIKQLVSQTVVFLSSENEVQQKLVVWQVSLTMGQVFLGHRVVVQNVVKAIEHQTPILGWFYRVLIMPY